jgi:transposase
LSDSTVRNIITKGKNRGYNPTENLRIKLEFIEDGKRSGRPKEISEATEQAVISSVTKDRNGREKSSEILAFEAGISHSSVLRILHKHGLVIAKPSWKPGLTEAAKAKRLRFCLDHQYWTLEDWKAVIFTDETSIVLGHRRGSIRVWRRVGESHDPTCVRRRWKGYSDFMVWGCFTYDKKGPLHVFEPETSQQRKLAEQEIEALNKQLEPLCKQEWEVNMQMSRLHLRGVSGRKPQWKWTEKNGKLVRKGNGGIDWWRYQKVSSEQLQVFTC